ncbi:MAG TPA: YggS family pyridoxal phosphate-dependent enzyme [Bacteroidia bacterium]
MVAENISVLKQEIGRNVSLVIVSKYRTIDEINAAYATGHRVFAENRVQALLERKEALPADIQWHLIGHLQTNKVKQVVPFVAMIQSVDSVKLLNEINEQAAKVNRVIDCLLQVHIAMEETKFGFSLDELQTFVKANPTENFTHINFRGLMGMATNTDDQLQIEKEFKSLSRLFQDVKPFFGPDFNVLSMGMSSDYKLAITCGSNMVRVGSAVFG